MRQLVYVMFLNKIRTSFQLRGKENLVKHQHVSKCYEIDCLENFVFHFTRLLTAPIDKTVIFMLEFNLSF